MLCGNVIFAQNSYPDSVFNFYPLEDGNYWEYEVFIGSDPIHIIYQFTYWLEVIGDTVLENGRTYKLLERGYFNDSFRDKIYERIDSSNTSVYRFESGSEYKIDSLACSAGDSINCSRFTRSGKDTYCYEVLTKLILNEQLTVKIMDDYYGIPNVRYELAMNLGLIAHYSWEGNSYEKYLSYAKIKGKEYGIKVHVDKTEETPTIFSLSQNYPNPFNSTTRISYSVPQQGKVKIIVYDVIGRTVSTLVNEEQPAGNY